MQHQAAIPLKEQLKIPSMLYDTGCEKLTFVGGEPLLSSTLPTLLKESKEVGLTTMIVTNGSLLSERFISEYHQIIDWISLSIDSQYEEIQFLLGRGFSNHVEQTIRNVQHIQNAEIRLKLNSVVTKYTINEEMGPFIERLQPERWKVFQMLPVTGQNDQYVGELAISRNEFDIFIDHHRYMPCAVFEDNDTMRGSYVMLSPDGRFFSNATGGHVYTNSILEIGVEKALEQNSWSMEKFQARGGLYSWASQLDNHVSSNIEEVIL